MTPLVWIFLAIISVLVLMIVLIGLVLRARCSKSSRQKAKFVRATDQHNTLLKEDRINTRGNNPDLIPDTGLYRRYFVFLFKSQSIKKNLLTVEIKVEN